MVKGTVGIVCMVLSEAEMSLQLPSFVKRLHQGLTTNSSTSLQNLLICRLISLRGGTVGVGTVTEDTVGYSVLTLKVLPFMHRCSLVSTWRWYERAVSSRVEGRRCKRKVIIICLRHFTSTPWLWSLFLKISSTHCLMSTLRMKWWLKNTMNNSPRNYRWLFSAISAVLSTSAPHSLLPACERWERIRFAGICGRNMLNFRPILI